MGSQSSYHGGSPVQRNATVPQLRSPVLPTTSTRCFQKRLFWCVSIALGPYSSSYLCAPPPSISLVLDLIALPPPPTSPSPTQDSSAAPILSITKLVMHRHVRIAFFRFPFVNLAHITSRLLIALCPIQPDDALNPPSSSPPQYPRRNIFVAGIALSTSGHHFPLLPDTTCGPLLVVHGRQQDQAAGQARRARAQPQRLTTQQQPQPKSQSPTPLRTLLRL